MAAKPDKAMVLFHYVNHAGKAAEHRVVPVKLWFGSTAWHPYPQWLLEAVDVDKGALRDFAMSNVSNWRPADGGS
jgi:predicted DNA-binding transcriptional regulator YafY